MIGRTGKGARKSGPRTLCIDIGGTGLKALVVDAKGKALTERARVETPRPATPRAVLAELTKLVSSVKVGFDRVSVGFPGVVVEGVVKTAPNLHTSWGGVKLAQVLEKKLRAPTRVLNDAGVQGFGVIAGHGVEMVLTLGTGLGCSLFVNGSYVPNLELAHHPFKDGRTYEEYVGNAAYEKIGKKKWGKRVLKILAQIDPIWNPTRIYLGGGNAKHLERVKKSLPKHVAVTDNLAGLLGGIALWQQTRGNAS